MTTMRILLSLSRERRRLLVGLIVALTIALGVPSQCDSVEPSAVSSLSIAEQHQTPFEAVRWAMRRFKRGMTMEAMRRIQPFDRLLPEAIISHWGGASSIYAVDLEHTLFVEWKFNGGEIEFSEARLRRGNRLVARAPAETTQ